MSAMRWVVPILLGLSVGGCGLVVPEIQENPFDRNGGQKFVQKIAANIRCEIQDAVVNLYAKNKDIDPLNRNFKEFGKWAAQVALTLTIDEKGSVNPIASWLPTQGPTTPNSIFSLGVGGTLSTDASRVEKISAFFLVSDLKKKKVCPPELRHQGMFILESDLKLEEWLFDTLVPIDIGDLPESVGPSGPFKSNVLSHEVKFEIVSSGNATPGWKLKQVTVNQSGNLFSVSRDRTQDLIITFGPADPAWTIDPDTQKVVKKPPSLAPAALNAMLAAEIGNAVSTAIRNSTQQ
jgi:hypothetical protein